MIKIGNYGVSATLPWFIIPLGTLNLFVFAMIIYIPISPDMLGQECLATDCLSILNFLGLSVCFFLIFHPPSWAHFSTGKSLSEALIFASTNPQYDNRLFIELQVQYMKIPSSNLGRTCCVQKLFLTFRTIFVHNMFSPCSAKRRASDKDLPVLKIIPMFVFGENLRHHDLRLRLFDL